MSAQGKTMGQIDAETQDWADRQEIVTGCALDGCGWKFTGTAAEGRERATEHRRESHPDLRPRSIGEIQRKKKQEEAQMKEEARKRAREETWPRERIVKSFKDFAKKHRRPPTSTDANNDPSLPSQTTVSKRFGSWGNGIVEAGFPRPTRGRKVGDERLAEPRPRVTVSRGKNEDKIVIESDADAFEGRVRTLVKGVLDEVEAEAILVSRDIRTRAAEIIRDALHSLTEEAA